MSQTPKSRVRIERATTPAELSALRELRYDVFIAEENWSYPPELVVGNQLHGAADAESVVLYAYIDDGGDR